MEQAPSVAKYEMTTVTKRSSDAAMDRSNTAKMSAIKSKITGMINL